MSFKYVNEDGIDIELKCPICYDPLQSPMNCDLCGSTYCKKCISHWLKERLACPLCQQSGNQFSPVICLVVINQLKRLLVQCELCKQENLQQDSFQNHLNCDCPNYIIHCPDGCSWQGKRHQLDEHSQKRRAQYTLVFSSKKDYLLSEWMQLAKQKTEPRRP